MPNLRFEKKYFWKKSKKFSSVTFDYQTECDIVDEKGTHINRKNYKKKEKKKKRNKANQSSSLT